MICLNLDKDKLVSHIKDKNQIMNMCRILDKIEIVMNTHKIQSTDFYDPYERRLAQSILNHFQEITYCELGGLEEAERKVFVIYPDYYQFKQEDIPICGFMIYDYVGRYSHRDFLGSILSLGINREKVGDILIHKNYTQIIVKNEISDYIFISLERIGNEKIKVMQIPLTDIKKGNVNYKEIYITVSSLRLDALISGSWNLSRQDSQKLIKRNNVKVNWEPIDKVYREVSKGDIVSVKGYGRFILDSIKGFSRKGRIRIKIRLLI
ncbi:RNA-binding protein [Keratinibaculum paraultunense]|uniref:YlmH family RNA-binding protein n=1 Tax=Keratinibaculum paraultunense TaxID=1278232 RepID=UPI0010495B4B|nr:YlmH/Sll1252 family protein [Keratinibaculum paraultunense]QQY80852.1 RNA-binding protein [Keratinibaculum paraultunense]